MTNIAELRTGDTIKVVRNKSPDGLGPIKGLIGTVIDEAPYSSRNPLVQFEGWGGGHSGNGWETMSNDFWFLNKDHIEVERIGTPQVGLAGTPLKDLIVGDRIRVIEYMDDSVLGADIVPGMTGTVVRVEDRPLVKFDNWSLGHDGTGARTGDKWYLDEEDIKVERISEFNLAGTTTLSVPGDGPYPLKDLKVGDRIRVIDYV